MSGFVHNLNILRLHRPTVNTEAYTAISAIESCSDCVIEEQRVAFYLNGHKLLSVMSLPQEQDAHLVGFLCSEGVLESIDDIEELCVAPDGLSVAMQARIDKSRLAHLHTEKTLTTGCCVGVSANFDGQITQKFIATPLCLKAEKIFELLDEFSKPSILWEQTGCVHKAMLVVFDSDSKDGNIQESARLVSEDVGRHNAIDKVIGRAHLQRLSLLYSALIVSGRLSMEMVIKAAMNDIPLVISRASTTLLGIKSAQILGVTLVGFARDNKLNIYTHPARIQAPIL